MIFHIYFLWRTDFITSFLERDIPQLGIRIPSISLRRFWIMLSHYNGQLINHAEMARSFGVSDMTVRYYLDILEGTFMIRQLHPWFPNVRKRLVRRPKLYFRDTGIFHALQGIRDTRDLMSHPKKGASWEAFVTEQLISFLSLPSDQVCFYGTHSGPELDLYWSMGGKNYGVEIKFSDNPAPTRSMHVCITDLGLNHLWIVYPGNRMFRAEEKITVLPLDRIDVIAESTGRE